MFGKHSVFFGGRARWRIGLLPAMALAIMACGDLDVSDTAAADPETLAAGAGGGGGAAIDAPRDVAAGGATSRRDAGVDENAPVSVHVKGCERDADCELPPTTPVACAEARCEAGECTLLAKDADHDTERSASCTALNGAQRIQTGSDCDDRDSEINTRREEKCDGKDNDCNGLIDDGVPPSAEECSTDLKGVCEGRGHYECENGQQTRCNAVPVAEPAPPDVRECDGVDRNCNGTIDLQGCACTPGQPFACAQTCGGSVTVVCNAAGEFPACDPGPAKEEYCSDLDDDKYASICAMLCPSEVRPGWKPREAFNTTGFEQCDGDRRRNPGLPEVCGDNVVDNNCTAGIGDEPPKECPGCGMVACGASCPALCPPGYTPIDGGLCESPEQPGAFDDDRVVCAGFPCWGLRTDEHVGGLCPDGQFRASVQVEETAGKGDCYGFYANANEQDCTLRVHYGADLCDCFTCSIHVKTVTRVPQCQ